MANPYAAAAAATPYAQHDERVQTSHLKPTRSTKELSTRSTRTRTLRQQTSLSTKDLDKQRSKRDLDQFEEYQRFKAFQQLERREQRLYSEKSRSVLRRHRPSSHFTKQGDEDDGGDDEEEEEDYGDVVRQWDVGVYAEERMRLDRVDTTRISVDDYPPTKGINDANASQPSYEFTPEQLERMHIRFQKPAPPHTLVPPCQIDPSIEPLVFELVRFSRRLPIDPESASRSSSSWKPASDTTTELDPHGIIAKINFPTACPSRWIDLAESTSMRPDGFVYPRYLLQGDRRERYIGWVREMQVYGVDKEGSKRECREDLLQGWKHRFQSSSPNTLSWPTECVLPDIFSRSHLSSALSNSRRIIISFLRPPQHDALTQIFATPAPALDLDAIGKAAVEFGEQYGYLGEAFRLGDFEKTWFDRVTAPDEVGKGPRAEIKPRPARLSSFDALKVPKIKHPGQTLTQAQVTQIVSNLSRSLTPVNPLTPGAHKRFDKYGATFHTYDRGYAGLWEDETSNDSNEINLAEDLQVVCAFTGHLGLSFVFDIDSSLEIGCTIHTSFHFWEIHQRYLFRLSQLLYSAVHPSFLIMELTRAGIKNSGWRLPCRASSIARDTDVKRLDIQYNRLRLSGIGPEVVWRGFPDPQVRRMERDYVEDFRRKVLHIHRSKPNVQDINYPAPPFPRHLSVTGDPFVETPTPKAAPWTPRPLHLSPSTATVFSPSLRSTLSSTQDTLFSTPHDDTKRSVSGVSEVTKMMGELPGALPKTDPFTPLPQRRLLDGGIIRGRYVSRSAAEGWMRGTEP